MSDEPIPEFKSARKEFLEAVGVEKDAHWRIVANIPKEAMAGLAGTMTVGGKPPTIALQSQIALVGAAVPQAWRCGTMAGTGRCRERFKTPQNRIRNCAGCGGNKEGKDSS